MEHARPFDANAFKEAQRRQWDAAAQGWNDYTPALRAWLSQATAAMVEMAGVRAGQRVLDLAAGAGDQTLALAGKVGPSGEVVATDISERILAYARARAEGAGFANVHTRAADGEALPGDLGHFDAAVCRLGLMLFPQPLQALRGLHAVLRPGAGFCAMVFSRPEANPCVTTVMATALRHAGLPPRDPAQPGGLLSLGAPGRLDALMREAGFSQVASTTLAAPFELPSAAHYVGFLRASASPIQLILSRLNAAAAEAAWADIEAQLHRFDTPRGWSGPNELLLAAGRA
ncbi:class I SAM-dependent methyltransferase [Ramlibacter rhizophilus]|uniref:Methyltransferase domain-containing protein n=1 Tax=Ramlibacter rhizophilus TaxID=1781167 RepID=A0A4Z0BE11_9BURK|nr:class I SAM-dependent methyltransferase [Ramlibacter rhizophilus]TFY97532.1 methyltransferase domain-containing protein [Ramlibacter rhizophilus]